MVKYILLAFALMVLLIAGASILVTAGADEDLEAKLAWLEARDKDLIRERAELWMRECLQDAGLILGQDTSVPVKRGKMSEQRLELAGIMFRGRCILFASQQLFITGKELGRE